MRNQKKHLFLIFLAIVGLTFVSCEREVRKFDISGRVYDPQLKKNISSAEVVLRGSKIQSGIYNSNYIDLQSTSTSSDGSYSFEVPEETVSGYRFYINKKDYFDQLIDVKTDDLQNNNGFTLNVDLIPIAYLKLSVKNTMPIGASDEIHFHFKNIDVQCKDCWNKGTITGVGPTYTYSRTAQTSGENELIIEWVVKKGGQQHIYSDTIFTKAFQTVDYNINY